MQGGDVTGSARIRGRAEYIAIIDPAVCVDELLAEPVEMWTVNVTHSIAPKTRFGKMFGNLRCKSRQLSTIVRRVCVLLRQVGGENGAAWERDPQLASAERWSGDSAQRESWNVLRLVARLNGIRPVSDATEISTRVFSISTKNLTTAESPGFPGVNTPFHCSDCGSIFHCNNLQCLAIALPLGAL
jgi:hypothetical protein